MIEKCKALTANQNTDLPEPASRGDVSEANPQSGLHKKSQQTTTASQTATA